MLCIWRVVLYDISHTRISRYMGQVCVVQIRLCINIHTERVVFLGLCVRYVSVCVVFGS